MDPLRCDTGRPVRGPLDSYGRDRAPPMTLEDFAELPGRGQDAFPSTPVRQIRCADFSARSDSAHGALETFSIDLRCFVLQSRIGSRAGQTDRKAAIHRIPG